MKLEFLTLNKLVDSVYCCGLDETPVSILIAAPPGSGKTWSTSAIKNADFVLYLNKVYSPTEHRALIAIAAYRTCLLINDDLGLLARWNQSEYFATLCMTIDGEVMFKQFKQTQHAATKSSVILCCTSDYFNQNRDVMMGMGLYDRVIPVILRLSKSTRRVYQEDAQTRSIYERDPPKRTPDKPEPGEVKNEIIREMNLDPRLTSNMRRVSRYLTDDETIELINVTNKPGVYEI